MKYAPAVRPNVHPPVNCLIPRGELSGAELVVGVIDAGPSGADPVVATEETVSSAHCPNQVYRRVGVAGVGFAETHIDGVGNIRDLGGGDRAKAHIRETIKAGTGWHPNFSGDPKNGPGPVIPRDASRVGPRAGEAGPAVGADIKGRAGKAVENIRINPVRGDLGPRGKTRTGRPTGAEITGITGIPMPTVGNR